MPHLRKVDPATAATWEDDADDRAPAELLAGLGDRSGLTRIDRDNEHAWRARVYHGGREHHKQFADALNGGPSGALGQAVAWRDAQRAELGTRPPREPRRTWRVVRAEYERLRGYLAYADRRRYFSDSRYGGPAGAKAAAEAWLSERSGER
jgi:hypothetical protein